MFYFRRLLTANKLTSLLIIGVVLRSLIASGFMLDTQPADGSLLSIKLCDGPAGINQLHNNDDHGHHHHHQAGHDSHEQHEQLTSDHAFSACSFWSSSSQLLLTSINQPDLTEHVVAERLWILASGIQSGSETRTHFARAPPALV